MKTLIRTAALSIILMIFAPFSAADDFDIPKGVQVLTAPEVRQKASEGQALLIHTLSQIEYQMQHIPGSINIPVDEIADSQKMPPDRNAAIILYCNGLACPYSRRASEIVVQRGYTNVYWFRGGILEWRKFQYEMAVDEELSNIAIPKLNPDKFREAAKNGVLILDVRPQWWQETDLLAGVIEGTEMMIPLIKLHQHLDRVPKERPILLVDRLMRQSIHAAKYLKLHGFNVIGVLKGGSKRWEAEGLPMLKQQDEPPMVSGY